MARIHHVISVLCFLTVLLLEVNSWVNDRPAKLHREVWGRQLIHINLLNMSMLLVKDTMYRIRQADLIQEEYKNSLSYELGLLAAGIVDKFRHMLRIYRYYSNHLDFKRSAHSVDQIMNGYAIMQSDYNEMLAERDLYLDVLDRHKRQKEEDDKELEEYAKKNPGMSPSRLKEARDKGLLKQKNRRRTDFNALNAIENNITEIARKKMTYRRMAEDVSRLEKLEQQKNRTEWLKVNHTEEEEYKKKLRYVMWAERWDRFIPEIEGIDIPMKIARAGLANESNFLLREFKGNV